MMKSISVRCCIAGGGPAGMMLGLLLARRSAVSGSIWPFRMRSQRRISWQLHSATTPPVLEKLCRTEGRFLLVGAFRRIDEGFSVAGHFFQIVAGFFVGQILAQLVIDAGWLEAVDLVDGSGRSREKVRNTLLGPVL